MLESKKEDIGILELDLNNLLVNFPYLWHVYNELAYLCSGNLFSGKLVKTVKQDLFFFTWII